MNDQASFGATPSTGGGDSDLPEAARARLRDQTWTSDLSVAELAAVRRAGFEPAGMVVGMTCYQIALQGYGGMMSGVGGSWTGQIGYGFAGYNRTYPCPHVMPQHPYGLNFEDTLYEQAVVDAYGLAHSRLVAEATELGAHGVVGVRHSVQPMALATQVPVVELKMIGTAVRRFRQDHVIALPQMVLTLDH